MKRIDFENGTVTGNILGATLPMLVAQILNLLYNIVDRVYIARIPKVGTAALGAVGLCFPIIVIITAFSNLFGSGGAPLFSIYRGKKQENTAVQIMDTSFSMLCICGVFLMLIGFLFARPILVVFGASSNALTYAYPYIMIYLIGTIPSMISIGMNPFINAQGYSTIGMLSVAIGAVANLLLDPLFIFVLGFGVQGAAIATILSQTLSAAFVLFFLTRKSELKVRFLRKNEISQCTAYAKDIVSLGSAGFIMQLTNSLVTICCNNVLSVTGGDIYISVMTIVSSVRQLVETPLHAINEGASPILSYNYGARCVNRVKDAERNILGVMLIFTTIMFLLSRFIPRYFVLLFTTDPQYIRFSVWVIRTYTLMIIPLSFQYVFVDGLTALECPKTGLALSVTRKSLVISAAVLPSFFGAKAAFFAEPVADGISSVLSTIVFLLLINRHLDKRCRMDKKESL